MGSIWHIGIAVPGLEEDKKELSDVFGLRWARPGCGSWFSWTRADGPPRPGPSSRASRYSAPAS